MKKARRILGVLSCAMLCFMLCAGTVNAANYKTKGYDVNVVVSENGVLQITETMDVDFHTPSHGIYRYIPYSGDITYEYGGMVYTSPYTVKIEDIDVPGFEKKVKNENGNVVVRMGSADQTVSGSVTYQLKYKAVVYDDRDSKLDQLYWGLIPTDTPTPTEKATFRIEMPKEFDASKVAFAAERPGKVAFIAGRLREADDMAVDFHVEGNTIYGETSRELMAGEGVTLRVELPEGYFTGAASHDWMLIPMWTLIVLAPLTTLLLWMLFGRDRKIVPTVEFYPPEGVSSAEVGYILDGVSDDKDIISMVMFFADKGYLEIYEDEKDSFRLIKKKELPETAKSYELTMFHGLFAKGDSVKLDELKNDFFDTFTAVKGLLGGEFTDKKGRKVYSKGSKIARGFSLFLMLNPLLSLGFLGSGYQYKSIGVMLLSIPLTLLVFADYCWLIFVYDRKDHMGSGARRGSRIGATLIATVGLAGFIGFGYSLNLMAAAVCAVVASIVCVVFAMLMKQRTAYSTAMMGKILGFKDFIRTAELPRLERLVEENPEYFYNVLPYAYVFGLTDKWAKNFEEIAVPQPSWYYSGYSGNVFTTYYFLHSFNRCTNTMASSMAIPPISQNGVGGLGGGFSGGGMGGGGMGSW